MSDRERLTPFLSHAQPDGITIVHDMRRGPDSCAVVRTTTLTFASGCRQTFETWRREGEWVIVARSRGA